MLYYISGIFKGQPHPTEKNELSKLNPLQRIIYLSFKIVLVPLLVITGLLYMFHKTIDENNMVVISNISLESIATWHTLGAFLLVAFVIVHIYMTTTGEKPTSNIKAMLTGYEEFEDKDENSQKNIP